MSNSNDNDDKKEVKVTFAPGCFDNLDITQEELDQLVEEIRGMAESGELMVMSIPLSELAEMALEDPELAAELAKVDGLFEGMPAAANRKLH